MSNADGGACMYRPTYRADRPAVDLAPLKRLSHTQDHICYQPARPEHCPTNTSWSGCTCTHHSTITRWVCVYSSQRMSVIFMIIYSPQNKRRLGTYSYNAWYATTRQKTALTVVTKIWAESSAVYTGRSSPRRPPRVYAALGCGYLTDRVMTTDKSDRDGKCTVLNESYFC